MKWSKLGLCQSTILTILAILDSAGSDTKQAEVNNTRNSSETWTIWDDVVVNGYTTTSLRPCKVWRFHGLCRSHPKSLSFSFLFPVPRCPQCVLSHHPPKCSGGSWKSQGDRKKWRTMLDFTTIEVYQITINYMDPHSMRCRGTIQQPKIKSNRSIPNLFPLRTLQIVVKPAVRCKCWSTAGATGWEHLGVSNGRIYPHR